MFQAHSVINPTMCYNSSQTQDKDFRRTRTGLEGNVVFSAGDSDELGEKFKGVGLISDIAGGCVVGGGAQDNDAGTVELLSLIINLVREDAKYLPPY